MGQFGRESWVVGREDTGIPLGSFRTLKAIPLVSRLTSHFSLLIFSRLNILLRKEVIQPHLPIRLPCYDFTPITNPTFDGSLLFRLSHRLRVLLAFVV